MFFLSIVTVFTSLATLLVVSDSKHPFIISTIATIAFFVFASLVDALKLAM